MSAGFGEIISLIAGTLYSVQQYWGCMCTNHNVIWGWLSVWSVYVSGELNYLVSLRTCAFGNPGNTSYFRNPLSHYNLCSGKYNTNICPFTNQQNAHPRGSDTFTIPRNLFCHLSRKVTVSLSCLRAGIYLRRYWVNQKVPLGFYIRYCRKTWMNFLANPICCF